MKLFERMILFFLLGCAMEPLLVSQTVTVPPASSSTVTISWNQAVGCNAAVPCTYTVYRVPGTVTIAAGTTGATALGPTTAQATSLVDSTVSPGSTYSYAAETADAGGVSGPSSTVTVAIPAAPVAPVVNSATAVASVEVTNGGMVAVAKTSTLVTLKKVPAPAAQGK